jgi:hypothetical protein
LMECEINEYPLGFELRVYIQGDFHYSRTHLNREEAEAEAKERNRELIAAGWTKRLLMPD